MSRRVGLRSMQAVGGTPQAIAETRLFTNVLHTVNGLNARDFGDTVYTDTQFGGCSANGAGDVAVQWGIRVWKRAADGTETEITSGTPVAVITVSNVQSPAEEENATWTCPKTTLESTDAIVVRVYNKFGAASWTERQKFISDQLNVSALAEAEWTVYLWIERIFQLAIFNRTCSNVFTGGAVHDCRVENFSYFE